MILIRGGGGKFAHWGLWPWTESEGESKSFGKKQAASSNVPREGVECYFGISSDCLSRSVVSHRIWEEIHPGWNECAFDAILTQSLVVRPVRNPGSCFRSACGHPISLSGSSILRFVWLSHIGSPQKPADVTLDVDLNVQWRAQAQAES